MKAAPAPAVDTVNAAAGPVQEMVIMTPQGVQSYTWPGATATGLPRELLGTPGGTSPSTDSATGIGDHAVEDSAVDVSEGASVNDGEPEAEIEVEDDVLVDPADLGL